jgi:hypothetical protein
MARPAAITGRRELMKMRKKRDRRQASQPSTALTLQRPNTPTTPKSDQPAGELPEKLTNEKPAVARVHQAFATTDTELIVPLLFQAMPTAGFGDANITTAHHYTVAAVHSLGARDGLEALLAVQMVGVHNLAMKFLANAALEDQTDYGIEVNVNRANRLLRTFTAQVEGLKKHRSKGEQHFTVEHVHVHSGGQAVVGAVNQGQGPQEAGGQGGKKRNDEQ